MSSEFDIYVSYARIDIEVVKSLIEDLRLRVRNYAGREVTFWIDLSYIAAGSDWQDALRNALAQSKAMLVVVSPAYLQSRFARREYETFALSGRPIFPIVLEEFHPNSDEVRTLLGGLQYYAAPNIRSRKRNKQYSEFIENLALRIADTLHAAELAPGQGQREVRQEPSAELPTQRAKGYVFLSYAEEDSDFLARLRAFFGDRGYAYWEYESSDRDYQKRIDLELEGVISDAVATVSILSEAWKASTWSLRELFFSQEIGKPVFLLKAKPISPTLAIAGFPYIDFTKDIERAFSRLASELRKAGL